MKKLLLSILSILIGFTCFGYCEDYTLNLVNNVDNILYDSNLNSLSGSLFQNGSVSNFTSTPVNFSLYFTGFSQNITINTIGYNTYSFYIYGLVCDNFVYTGVSNTTTATRGKLNLGGITLNDNQLINCHFLICDTVVSNTGDCPGYTRYQGFGYKIDIAGSRVNPGSYYLSLPGLGGYISFLGSVNGGNNAYTIPNYIDFSISTPTFTINYGSNIYEVTEDTDIYINSPVLKDGNTFTCDGILGINLFYNGGSYFYDKDKLYVNTPSWYNNGIFTPVCL